MLSAGNSPSSRNSCKHNTSTCSWRIISATAAAVMDLGAPGRFDNHIHRITCLSDTGHSLHVYSDDALRGEVYREE